VTGIRTALSALGQHGIIAVAFLGLVLVGIGFEAASGIDRASHRLAVPLGLLVAMVAFFLVTGIGRAAAFGADFAAAARYSHVAVVLLVPALAVGADVAARKLGTPGSIAVVAVLLAGVPGNISDVRILQNRDVTPGLVMALPRVPAAERLPAGFAPFADEPGASAITIGFLREAVRSGRLPDDASPASRRRAEELVNGLVVVPVPRPGAECGRTLRESFRVRLDAGQSVVIDGAVIYIVTDPDGRTLPPEGSGAGVPTALVAVRGPVEVAIGSFNPARPARLCS
jgi:hypothetical protein